jgi:hypothetical protein
MKTIFRMNIYGSFSRCEKYSFWIEFVEAKIQNIPNVLSPSCVGNYRTKLMEYYE